MNAIHPRPQVLLRQIGLCCVLVVAAAVLYPEVAAFAPVVPNQGHRLSSGLQSFHRSREVFDDGRRTSFRLFAELSSAEKDDLLATIRSMRVKELKAELEERKISTRDAFEKEELVKRLFDARLKSPEPPKAATKSESSPSSSKSNRKSDSNVIRGELSFVSMNSDQSIAGMYNSESIRITDAESQPYPTMIINVVDQNSNSDGFPLKLLVDTACSGLVLTPLAVQRNNMQTDSRPVTISGAGGSGPAMGFGTTQINRFTFGYDNNEKQQPSKEFLGPLLAAVQDIGALESLGLDGIIGLSFLARYACTEIDLDRSELTLYKNDYRPNYDENDLEIVAEAELSPTRLNIWTVDVAFDLGTGKRGTPIKMLVDTGSTSTILSEKGLEQMLGLSKASPEVKAQQEMGAIGSDNAAMSLTHKIEVDRPIRFGRQSGRSPPQYNGLTIAEGQLATVDIGEIAILDTQLSADNVGGILGMNVLAKASMIRMVFSGPIPRITLFQKKSRNNSGSDSGNNSSSDNDDSGGDDTMKTKDSKTPNPATTSKAEPDTASEPTATSTAAAPATEEPKPRRKKKKRRY